MSSVYLARDVRHDRMVALKVMRPELAAVLGAERFLREIQISARLRHPHILPLYDSGEAGGSLFYVMPYVEGESLRARLDRDRQLSIEEALRIAREVADALGYAHAHDVVHRDIKPDNILLESGHAVVADFGIARAITVAGGDRLTETGLAVGTPVYMSPEQAAGETSIDGRSDVYALGCVLYEMLTGQAPHAGGSAQAIVARRLTEPPAPVRETRETVPRAVERAVSRALARLPADRFATATEFAAALPTAEPVPESAGPAPTATPTARSPWLPALASTLVLLAAVVVVILLARGIRAPAGEDRPTLVVLPFQNLGEPEDEYFADGITEEMTSRLAEISGLGITSRTSAIRYKGSTKSLREIGDELNVQYVLEGTVRTDRAPGDVGQVRVTPQLIRVSDDTHLWTTRYSASLTAGEVFDVQARIAEQVATALDVTLLARERAVIAKVPTVDEEAHDAYLLGRYYWNRRTAADLQRGARHFVRATERDPRYAAAFAGLADTYVLFPIYRVPGIDRADAYQRAQAAARRALALDSTLAEAHASLALAIMYGEWDWEAAESGFRRALTLDPDYAVAHYWYTELLASLGRNDEALAHAERAVRLDPAAPVARHLSAIMLYSTGRHEEALAREREALELQPDFVFAYGVISWILIDQGRYDEARPAMERAGFPPEVARDVPASYRDTALRPEAVAAITRARLADRSTSLAPPGPASVGLLFAMVRATDSAFAWFDRAIEQRDEMVLPFLRNPVIAHLQTDPRYAALLRRLRLEP